MVIEEEASKNSDHENLLSEIHEDFTTEIDEINENSRILEENLEEKNLEKFKRMGRFSKTKFANAKSKILLNKTKNRLETKVIIEIHQEANSSVSESVTKSPRSKEKKDNNEKSMKEYWLLFRKKFFFSNEIKKFKKKV